VSQPTLDRDAVEGLAAEMGGRVLLPGDGWFESEVAGFNAAAAHRPDVVVGATSAEDIQAAVAWAAMRKMPIAVQATGHGHVANLDGGMLIVTRRMREVSVDPEEGTARVEAGARWAQVIEAAAPYGLAPLNGSTSHVGAVGYSVGGGMPVLGRTYGFAADRVRSLEVVTADGTLRQVDALHHPDLFWALRGGKGNFGIVTSMVIDLVPVSTVYGGAIVYPGAEAATVLHAYREWADTLPDETTTAIALMRFPDLEMIPEPLRGQFVVNLRVAHVGSAAEGAELLAPMRGVAPVIVDSVAEIPYTAVDTIHQDPTDPMPTWERGGLLRELTAETVDALLTVAGPGVETPLFMVDLRQLGGALATPPEAANAVAGRDGAYTVWTLGLLVPPIADAVPVAGAAVHDAVADWSTGGSLLNFLGQVEGPEQVNAVWEPEVLDRLRRIKRSVDPLNLFRTGHAFS
jgi:FAD/FMN-containing dehydrogenase